jgi:hypothetical protein
MMSVLDSMFSAHEGNSFLETVLGQSAALGDCGSLPILGRFTWTDLNRLLKNGGLNHPRLRLLLGSAEVPATEYIRVGESGYHRPVPAGINRTLAGGGVLAIEAVHELNDAISMMCEELERCLELVVQADLYASTCKNAQSSARWNDHDVILICLEGDSEWTVHSPTVVNPMATAPPPEPDDVKPDWMGSVCAGKVLYIPRGWWYSYRVGPLPTLLLAVKFRNPTGADVVSRACQQLLLRPTIQTTCPRFASSNQKIQFFRLLHEEAREFLNSLSSMLVLQSDIQFFAEPRVHFELPWSGVASGQLAPDEWQVVALVRFPGKWAVRTLTDEESVELFVDGKCIKSSKDALWLFETLREEGRASVRSLIQKWPFGPPVTPLFHILDELADSGAIAFALEQRHSSTKSSTVGLREI